MKSREFEVIEKDFAVLALCVRAVVKSIIPGLLCVFRIITTVKLVSSIVYDNERHGIGPALCGLVTVLGLGFATYYLIFLSAWWPFWLVVAAILNAIDYVKSVHERAAKSVDR